jgi:predicted RNA-binding protein with PUA-like domain
MFAPCTAPSGSLPSGMPLAAAGMLQVIQCSTSPGCYDPRDGAVVWAGLAVKEEPENYPYEQLVRDGTTVWAGVKNPLAQKHLRCIRRGDRVFYYHTGKVKAIVGVATAACDAYPDPKGTAGSAYVVDLVPDHALPHPVTLASVKAEPFFASFALVRMGRLSVMPVSDAEWARLEKMSRG